MSTRNHELAYVILKYELGDEEARKTVNQLKNKHENYLNSPKKTR